MQIFRGWNFDNFHVVILTLIPDFARAEYKGEHQMKRLVILLVAISLISAVIAIAQTRTQSPPEIKLTPGRYQIVINPNVRADTFLLDTETGRVWHPIQYSDIQGKPSVWKFDERVDNEHELEDWLLRQKPQ
jgi:hypothetical protein